MIRQLKQIYLEALSAVHPDRWMAGRLDELAAARKKPFTHVFGVGKAAFSMARPALHHPLTAGSKGMLIVPHGLPTDPVSLDVYRAAHPVPDTGSMEAAQTLKERLASLRPSDRFLFLLSGGSSSLMEDPMPPLTLPDIRATFELLLRSGLPIHDVNRIRTALSTIKGGGLADCTAASGTVLVMSDVPGNRLDIIGSGPFYPGKRNLTAICQLLKDNALWNGIPTRVRDYLNGDVSAGQTTRRAPAESRIEQRIVLDNSRFLNELAHGCRMNGIQPVIMAEPLDGEARKAGQQIARETLERSGRKGPDREVLIWGGETTVTVTGTGKGGRSQEACLSALVNAAGHREVTFLFAGTDGIDGPTDAAGAVAVPPPLSDSRLLNTARHFLEHQDSYHYFQQNDGLIKTGWTGVNIMDVALALIRQ